ncbi:MAG: FdhF/YdeP family oxidoreductase [Pyrinomonadaceae bacterium]|nr:FdhF/YdeP family oxidoreductase [Pyrinomonadaceae bacterium]
MSKRKQYAAGLQAIFSTFKETTLKTGLLRGTRLLLNLNQKDGIDCNACAWTDPEGDRTFAEFCENGAKAIADEAVRRKVDESFFSRYSVEELAEKDDKWLNSQGRLTKPMFLAEGESHYKPISWEKAFRIIADELNQLATPDEAVFYTSGRTSNEAAFLYQLFVRQFGTNNLPDCSNMCHESSSVALTESIGFGKATIRLEDIENAELIIIMGQNPGTNAPRMMTHLKRAKESGGKIIAVNPLPEAGLMGFIDPNPQHYASLKTYALTLLRSKATKFADLYLPVRIGGDMAFLKGLMKALLEMEKKSPTPISDHEFINEKTEGFQDFVAHLESISWEDVLFSSGLSLEQIQQAARMYAEARSVVTCWAMGITQHKQAVGTIQDIVNLHLLRGNIGKPGAGLCPVRGHSNVQGDRTMGIWTKINPIFRQRLEREFHFKVPDRPGYTTVEAIRAMYEGRVKVFFALGGNFLSAAPDTKYTEKALRNCNLTVQVITKLNRTAVVTGKKALILPCLGRTEKDLTGGKEQFVSTESTMLNVQMSKGILEPISEDLRSEVWIIGKMAQAVLKNKVTVDWERMINDYDLIREAISKVVPGCENYNHRVRQKGGFYLPNPPRERIFLTDSGRAKFIVNYIEPIKCEKDELLLTTIRAHDQFNTTIYSESDRYRGISGSRRVIFMNPKDIERLGLKEGSKVKITSTFNGEERSVEGFRVVKYPIAERCAAMYFPEANPLISIESVAEKSLCPTSKLVKVKVTTCQDLS